jgi:hypothetical protein
MNMDNIRRLLDKNLFYCAGTLIIVHIQNLPDDFLPTWVLILLLQWIYIQRPEPVDFYAILINPGISVRFTDCYYRYLMTHVSHSMGDILGNETCAPTTKSV